MKQQRSIHRSTASLPTILLLLSLQLSLLSNHVAECFLSKPSSRTQNLSYIHATSTMEDEPAVRRKSRFSPFSRNNNEKKNSNGDHVAMTFTGIHSVSSPFVPKPKNPSLVMEYFAQESNRNLLFPKNEAITLDDRPTPEQVEVWNREAVRGGGMGPIMDLWGREVGVANGVKQTLFQIRAPLEFPGMKITSQSIIGMICVQQAEEQMPEYQFTLLESQTIPEGPKPLVWLFNQLTKYQDATSSFTRVQAKVNPRNPVQIQFVTDARLAIQIKLPSKMLRLLPNVNVKKFEEQGSASIQKLLETDLQPALNEFCEGFREFGRLKMEEECAVQELEVSGTLRP